MFINIRRIVFHRLFACACISLLINFATADNVFYVDDDAVLGGDGSSWDNAYTYLQDAITHSDQGDIIRVAQGDYYPDRSALFPEGTKDRNASFIINKNINLFGGYAGLNHPTNPDERNLESYLTVLCGDLNQNDGAGFQNYGDNSYNVVRASDAGICFVLNGFTVMGGNADGLYKYQGGGIYINECEALIEYCIFKNNTANYGGGLCCDKGVLTINNTVFINNRMHYNYGEGAGVYIFSVGNANLSDCSFQENTSLYNGGAISSRYSSVLLHECKIQLNQVNNCGGGIFNYHGELTLEECVISDNHADNNLGGGIYNSSYSGFAGNAKITNCEFYYNSAKNGGAIYATGDLLYEVKQCVFENNTARFGAAINGSARALDINTSHFDLNHGDAVYFNWTEVNITHCDIMQSDEWGVLCNSYSNVTLDQCQIMKNNGGVAVKSDSYGTITNCTIFENIGGSGGIYCWNSDLQVVGSVISGNTAENGGGINLFSLENTAYTHEFSHCIISNNHATAKGGGLFLTQPTTPQLKNSIIWNNSDQYGNDLFSQIFINNSNPVINYCCIQGWIDNLGGTGNFGENPELNEDGFHIKSDSPCINRGDPAGNYDGQNDIDGQPRVLLGRTDVGVDEIDKIDDSLRLILPNGGETLYSDHTYCISWVGADDIKDLRIEYSVNKGLSWQDVDISTIENKGSYLWQIPRLNSSNCLIRICDQDKPSIQDVSDRLFEIVTTEDDVINVPADYPNIQEAVNASFDGDTIVLMPGIYRNYGNRDVNLSGKSITIRSANPDDPFIVSNTVIDVEGTKAGMHRAFVSTADAEIKTVIYGITIKNGCAVKGGAIYCSDSGVVIKNCQFYNNRAEDYGGAIYFENGVGSIVSYCKFIQNGTYDTPSNYGGGVYFKNSTDINIISSEFVGNYAGHGAALYLSLSDVIMSNCIISNNSGGYSSLRLIGGVSIENCTIAYNQGQIDVSNISMKNSIVWGNSLYDRYNNSDITFSCIEGGWPGEGNIDNDPHFALDTDYHLVCGSPCIDAGTELSSIIDDIEDSPRPIDGDHNDTNLYDMGAYEYVLGNACIACEPRRFEVHIQENQGQIIEKSLTIKNSGENILNWRIVESCPWLSVVPGEGISSGEISEVTILIYPENLQKGYYNSQFLIVDESSLNGVRVCSVDLYVHRTLSVPSEYETIQAAIDDADDGDLVLVADGTYRGEGNRDMSFNGKEITVRSVNGADHCIIDCEGAGRGFMFYETRETPKAVVEGFTITNGYWYDSYYGCCGSGIRISESSPTIKNCIINNCADGIVLDDTGALVDSCVISNNMLNGIRDSSYYNWHPAIRNTKIISNANYGICLRGKSIDIVDCIIADNEYGIHYERDLEGTVVLIDKTTVADNRHYGLYAYPRDDKVLISNSIFWNNTEGAVTDVTIPVSYSCIEGGWPGEGNVACNPEFVNPGLKDYHLLPDSKCIDSGDPSCMLTDNETDIDGEIRVINNRVDMGADEFMPLETTLHTLNSIRIGRTTFEYTCSVILHNVSDYDLNNVVLKLVAVPNNISIIDGEVVFNSVAAGESVISEQTCTLIIDRSQPVKQDEIVWHVLYEIAGSNQVGQMNSIGVNWNIILSDITSDNQINLKDFVLMNHFWLQNEPSVNLAIPDDIIDISDLTILMTQWLDGAF